MAERDIIEQMRLARVGREKADANREGFFELHQRQKETFITQADRLDHFESTPGVQINSLYRLRVYVKLLDLNLGVFIGGARTRARTAYLTGTRNWHEHYNQDIADIDIQLRGRSVFITIMAADAFSFEFATSGKPVVLDVTSQNGVGIQTYKGCMVGVNVRLDKGVLQTKSTILKQKRDSDGTKLSLINRPYQVQLVNEPVSYPNTEFKLGRVRAKETLFEGYPPTHPWTGVMLRNTDGPVNTFQPYAGSGPSANAITRDVNYDIPYQDNTKLDPVRTAYIQGAADWPRANGKQTVTSSTYGDREFAIYVDAFNQFAIFPVDAIGPLDTNNPLNQNVPEIYVTRITPTLPSWAFQPAQKAKDYYATTPDTVKWCVDQPEYDWKFNHTGTKCAAIAFERSEYKNDPSFWATDSNVNCPWTTTKFDTFKSWMGVSTNSSQAFSPQVYNPQRYFIAPGVLELEITISLTGADLNQYWATIKVNELRRPSTALDAASRCAMFIGYVWYDVKKNSNINLPVPAGTLVEFDVECWIKPLGNKGQLTQTVNIMVCRTLTSPTLAVPLPPDVVIFSIPAMPILAIDLTTLSLVTRLDLYTNDRRYVDGGATALTFTTHHFGAWIIHNGISKEILFPPNTPDSAKLALNAKAALNGYATITATFGTGGELIPLTTPKDGYVDTPINNYRNWWSYQSTFWYDMWFAVIDTDLSFYGDHVLYKTTGSPPGYPADGDDTEKWLFSHNGDFRNLLFCDNPKWGWNRYAILIDTYMNVHGFTTFYTHPNGTYAFWSDAWVYDRNGLPGDYSYNGGSGSDYTHDTLGIYDPTLVDHVIFDRVHFEILIKDAPAVKRNTSFMDLYNSAVKAGVAAGTLPDSENILPMELKDLQATFIKEIGNDLNWERLFLDLKMTWDGRDWWYREEAWSRYYGTGTDYPPVSGSAGNFNTLSTYGYWRTTSWAGGGYATAPGNIRTGDPWHIRFANPIVLMEK
jgi:hypothetical protein